MRPRFLSNKILALGTLTTFLIIIYTFTSPEFSFYPSDWSSIFPQRQRGTCAPEDWSSGFWKYSPNTDLPALTDPDQALLFHGFEGCAADREYKWHLGTDHPEQWDRFPDVSAYKWQPSSRCDARPLNGAAMVRDMVENGGWLLLGDSITENHFFSLSCLLYPHVRATPNYTENPYFDRAWAQNLYLSPTSPLLTELDFPSDFSVENTPLVTFRRVDLLLNREDLESLYHSALRAAADGEDPSATNSTSKSLFSSEQMWSSSPSEYMPAFLSSPPDGNYGTLVVSTAGHWTTTLMSAFRDEEAGDEAGWGIEGVKAFFKVAMRTWAGQVQGALDEYRRNGGTRPKQVVVRAYLPGHEDCHDHRKPWSSIEPYHWNWYNWPWIGDFNAIFQELLATPEFPDISYLPIDRPGRLRPDAHAAGDCLHILTGPGVLEGWSHYIWHYVTREMAGRIR
ncbi:hypothetical protein PAXRUDRAFT_149979 [Paxillus rubicundulus Ve08.2h10]|uniref:Uncharacterized protein n=1 Tax=Paxillus rubicundulus Ve08.2h10 TaxID=930991 RepID=A0A0D0DXQ4_9AGAM|nr:hypothetical protein PAXRUDRAFT_149979 [Paxillus rubicundulus Ve08.2h10]